MHNPETRNGTPPKAISNYENNSTGLWDRLTSSQKRLVKIAQAQLLAGKGKTHNEVMKKYKRYYLK